MSEILIVHEPYVRLAVFACIFALMAAWEILAPCRRRGLGRQRRWPGNLGIVALDTLLVRAVFPTTAVGVAIAVEGANWGMLNVLGVSKWFAVATPSSLSILRSTLSTCSSMRFLSCGGCIACTMPISTST